MNTVNRVLVGMMIAVLGMLGALAWYSYDSQGATRQRTRVAQRTWLRGVNDVAHQTEGAMSPLVELKHLRTQQVAGRTQMASRWQPERPRDTRP